MAMETVNLNLDEVWNDTYGIRSIDYHIDFVTFEQYCDLPTGKRADIKDTSNLDDDDRLLFFVLFEELSHKFKNQIDNGRRYAEEHGIRRVIDDSMKNAEETMSWPDGAMRTFYWICSYFDRRRGWAHGNTGSDYEKSQYKTKGSWCFYDEDGVWFMGVTVSVVDDSSDLLVQVRMADKNDENDVFADFLQLRLHVVGTSEDDAFVRARKKFQKLIPDYEFQVKKTWPDAAFENLPYDE